MFILLGFHFCELWERNLVYLRCLLFSSPNSSLQQSKELLLFFFEKIIPKTSRYLLLLQLLLRLSKIILSLSNTLETKLAWLKFFWLMRIKCDSLTTNKIKQFAVFIFHQIILSKMIFKKWTNLKVFKQHESVKIRTKFFHWFFFFSEVDENSSILLKSLDFWIDSSSISISFTSC